MKMESHEYHDRRGDVFSDLLKETTKKQGRRKAFKSEEALSLGEGQSPLGGLRGIRGMLLRKILRFDIVRDRI